MNNTTTNKNEEKTGADKTLLDPQSFLYWDYKKNNQAGLNINDISKNLNKKAWWICPKCKQSWQLPIKIYSQRTSDICNSCLGRGFKAGVNDLKTLYPDLIIEWDYEKNTISPDKISAISNDKTWWKCKECERSWQAKPYDRTMEGRGCRKCKSLQRINARPGINDLATTHPRLLEEWDYERNTISPTEVSAGSDKKVWWIGKCKHSWISSIKVRTSKGYKCAVCAGRQIAIGMNDLATTHPDLIKEWDPNKNVLLSTGVTAGSNKYAYWLCNKGHSWSAKIQNRTANKRNCPYCAGQKAVIGETDLASTHPALAKELAPNSKNIAKDVTFGSDRKVDWVCKKGHTWQAAIKSRTTKGSKCPTCYSKTFVSKPELDVFNYVRNLCPDAIGTYKQLQGINEIDIYIPSLKIGIEFNGLFWHSSLKKSTNYHYDKFKKCQEHGIALIQIWEDEWIDKKEIVKSMLAHKLNKASTASVYARKTSVKELPQVTAQLFLIKNHIQGYVNSSVRLGLYDNQENLVAVAIFKKRNTTDYELLRYATSTKVPGGLGKLLAYLNKNYPVKNIITFADHCVSTGAIYEKLGFEVDAILPPDYKYLEPGKVNRIHKFNYRKDRFKKDPNLLYKPNLTEHELSLLNKINRIYDAGKTRYILHL